METIMNSLIDTAIIVTVTLVNGAKLIGRIEELSFSALHESTAYRIGTTWFPSSAIASVTQ